MQKVPLSTPSGDKKLTSSRGLGLVLSCDPKSVLERAAEEAKTIQMGVDAAIDPKGNIIKALSLNEFDNGMFATTVVGEMYKTMVIDLMRKFQEEYNCRTTSEKATCELAAISYIRMLEAQRKFNNALELGHVTALLNPFLAIMSKEIDRATRHYLTAIQTLRIMRQSPLHITVKAHTAIVGQNQLVQTNNL